jgi:DNA ligase-1
MYHIVDEIGADNSRLHKEAVVEREALAGNNEFFEGCKMAYDPMITFGVKKVPTHGGPDGQGLPWPAFKDLVDKLAKRELTGHAARDAIELCLSASTQAQWNGWYRKILIKDMRAGFSETTINSVCKKLEKKQYMIPLFECQLAHDGTKNENSMTGKKLIEVKLDGVRVLTVVYPDGRVDQYSRNGKELVNFEHIKEQFAKTASSLKEPTVFDGEVMSSSFQDLMKQVHRKSDVAANDAVLHLFDYVPLHNFKKGMWDIPQYYRIAKLKAWKEQWAEQTPNVEVLSNEEVDLDTQVGEIQFKDINKRAIDGGYEGIMVKDPEAPYECKRSKAWLKVKPFIEVSLKVVGIEEGTGRNEGKLGALVCEGEDDGKFISVNCGSGFTDQQRDDFWTNKDNLQGHVVEIRADAATRSQDSQDVWSLRFPRFLRFRGFKAGEKI